jgi:MFS family permease
MSGENISKARWYDGVSRYSWLVLAIASAGWVFDTFEGQIFNISRNQLLQEILRVGPRDPSIKLFGDFFLAVFLVGGTAGGLLFGSLADRFGRRPTMIATILMYSIFSGLTYFAHSLWSIGLLRFLVAMGVGGEWAVAASLVAEVFPKHARAHASGIFHATSVVGTWLATLAGLVVGAHWRLGFVVGVVPALLVLWVRSSVRESDRWQSKAEEKTNADLGSFRALLRHPQWSRRAWLGMLLAAVGLASFWGVTVAGQNLVEEMLRSSAPPGDVAQKSKFAYGIIETAGGGLGLLAFGPLSVRLGRKKAFVLMQLAALAIVPITCYVPQTYGQLLLLLPVFGFFTLSMHAGFAIYFPELFPTHLRATGTGFCFNGGRIVAAPMLWFSGWLKSQIDLRLAITLLGLLFVLGLLVVFFLPETKDQPLPE